MTGSSIPRREWLRRSALATAALAPAWCTPLRAAPAGGRFHLSTFSADVTPPLGSMLFALKPAKRIVDPLSARGFVLAGAETPLVFVSVDWLEIRNDAYDRWRSVLAAAAGTTAERVLVCCVHQHDAPIADLRAQRIIDKAGVDSKVIDLEFHEAALQRVAQSLREAMKKKRPISHLGLGQGRVRGVASNRRVVLPDGRVDYGRGSSSGKNPVYREAEDGTIDPWLKTISFWDGDRAVAALSCYATHPMSYYGGSEVSADFPGLARARRQADEPAVFQIYASGCSGNVTAGKYNNGSPENRPVLAGRLHEGMVAAWNATDRQPLTQASFRCTKLRLEPRGSPGFTDADLRRTLLEKSATPFSAFARCKAAIGLSWRERVERGQPIDVPAIDFGPAQLLLLPAESYVEYQLFAQSARPGSFVMAVGYGESAPGYIPVEKAWAENDSNLRDWCWVGPGAETAMKEAIVEALKR